MKTTVQLSTGFYELEAHGPIHVNKNGSYWGCIEFAGGFGPVTEKMVQSATNNTVSDLGKTPEDTVAIEKAIRRIMPVSCQNSK
jgi:hypothetical protein